MSLHDAAENTQELIRALYRAQQLAALHTNDPSVPLIVAVRFRSIKRSIEKDIERTERIGLLLGELAEGATSDHVR